MLLLFQAALAGTWAMEHQIPITVFPLGTRYLGTAEYRTKFPWQNKDDELFEDVYFAAGPELELCPVYARAGGRIHVVPVAVLDITADFVGVGYFDAFNGMTDFDAPGDDHSEAAFETASVLARRHSGYGYKLGVTPTLQAKVSHLIVALPQEFAHFVIEPPEGATGDYWYEAQYDTLLRWDDTVMVNSGMAFWEFDEPAEDDKRFFWLGARFDHQLAFGTEERSMKLGPMAVFRPSQSRWVPTTALFVQAYLESQIRSPLPPYIVAAFFWN
ncbi:hypothetical protein LBMAG42_37640 [Deltaproteobacteria bacterium]|nr:hypothetical protein LBMAG42_37640 [Deltaproteobacteria bacterium]